MEVSGQLHVLAALPCGERAPGTYWMGGWVGFSRADVDVAGERKIPRQKSNPSCPIHSTKCKTQILLSLTFI